MLSRRNGNHDPRLIAYCATLGGSVLALFALRHVSPNIWQFILRSDFGNALAALVAVGGYLLDHWNQRKTQQLEAQIQRVTAQSHEFLVPVTIQFQALFLGSLLQFVDKHMSIAAHLVEAEYGDASYSSTLLKQYTSTPVCEEPTDLENPASVAYLVLEIMMGERREDASDPSNKIRGGLNSRVTAPRELPKFLHRALETCKRPNSKLWKSYESFIRHEFVPGVERIAEIINEHGHLMEALSPERLEKLFESTGNGQGQKWTIIPRMWFYSRWLAYARSWQSLLATWDEGDYNELRPLARFPVGMLFFNIEAQTIVANKEKELVGMSQMHFDPLSGLKNNDT